MPNGLIVMKYDERSGFEIMAKYPEEKVEISNQTLMHILNMHEFSTQPGIVSLTIQSINFVTYYSGSGIDFFFILILNMLEDPEDYEHILESVSKIILENLEEKRYIEMLPSLFKQIVEHPKNRNNI